MADESRQPSAERAQETPLDAPPTETSSSALLPTIAGVVLLVGAALLTWSQLGTGGSSTSAGAAAAMARPGEKKPVAVKVAVVEEDALTEEQRIPGEILPARRASLKAESGGTLVRLKKRLGDAVVAGELIGAIDAGTLPAEVKRAEALAAVATARRERQAIVVAQLERDVLRKQKLESEGATSKTEREKTEHDLALARADLAIAAAEELRARSDVDILVMRLDDTRVLAPFAGRVSRVHIDEGSVVTPGAPIVDVVAGDIPHVAFSVRESERSRLRMGAPVDVHVPLPSGEIAVVKGEVERIGAELDPASRTLLVEAKLFDDEKSRALLPGTFVDIVLALGATEQGLVVPREALIGRGPVRTLFVVDGEKARAVDVTVLVEDGARAAVSGAEKGALVVVDGRDLVKDGAVVDVQNRAGGGASGGAPVDGADRRRGEGAAP